MKNQFLFLYMALIISVGYSLNVDYGASIDSFTGFNLSDDSYAFGYEKLSLYSSLQFTDNFSLAADGFYKFSYNSSSTPDKPHTLDFATLLATFSIGDVGVQLGRGYSSDYGGDIISHTLDGVTFTFPLSFATLIARVGYSGLINSNEVSLFATSEDEDEDGDLDGVNRIIEGADLVKEFESTTIWASLYGYQDVQSLGSNLAFYLGGGVNGSILTDFYYSVRGNIQTGQFQYLDNANEPTSSSLFAGMGVLSLNWYIKSENELLTSLLPSLNVNFGMSSGDSDLSVTGFGENHDSEPDGVSLYSPMNSGGPGIIYSINNQNLTYFKIMASVSPLEVLQTQLGSTLFFRTVEGTTSNLDIDPDADPINGNYMGTEISLTANYRPFSDLGVSASAGLFFPDGTIVTSGISGMLTVYLSLSL